MIALVLAASLLDAGPSDKLALRPAADFTIIGLAVADNLLTEVFKSSLTRSQCRICGQPGGIDGWFHDELTGWLVTRETSNTASDVWVYGLLPAGALAASYTATGSSASEGAGVRAALIMIESATVAGALVETSKYLVVRERPYAAYGHAGSGGYALDSDSRLSLPSGHTAWATAFGVSVAMEAGIQDSPAAPWLWGAAAASSVGTGMLRMMAEKHYFFDVLSGAAIGAACGVAFPLLHRRGSALSVAANGSSLAVSGAF